MIVERGRKNKMLFISTLILSCTAFLSFFIFSTFFPFFANTPSGLELNYSQRFPRNLHIEGNKISIDQIPLLPQFNYIMVILKNENGQEVYREKSKNQSGNLSFTLNNVSDGRYSFEIYTALEEYTSYTGLLYGKSIELTLNGGNASLVAYPYYVHNMSVMNNKRTDEKALLYYKQPSCNVQSDNREIIDLAASITAGIDNDYSKTVAIHDWICNNIYYDMDSVHDGSYVRLDTSALGTLHSKKNICDGYSNLAAALLRAAGIPSKRITGFAMGITSNSWPQNFDATRDINHAWNEVWLNGRWVIFDSTWDCGNVWENGTFAKKDGLRGYHYFDISPDFLSSDHIIADYSEENIPK